MRSDFSVLKRALTVLEAFDGDHLVMKLSELAARTEMPQTTVYRYVVDLVAWGALDKSPGGGYQIGLRMVELAAHCPRSRPLRDMALPFMEDLYEATHQNVQLAVRDGTDVVFVELLAGRGAVVVHTRVGARWPIQTTGVGLAILAHCPNDVVEAITARPMVAFTPKTIDTPERLWHAIAEVRRTGVAVSDGQITLDGYSVAAPIFGSEGVAAALSVVVPADDTRRASWAPAVRTAANGITRRLSGH